MNKELVSSDSRWFLWAVVIILVSGISLVSYIKVTEIQDDSQVTAETLKNKSLRNPEAKDSAPKAGTTTTNKTQTPKAK